MTALGAISQFVQLWLRIRPIRRFKNWRARRKGVPVLKGKLTYASIGVLLLSWAAAKLDVPLLPEDAEKLVELVVAFAGTVGALYGRWRATRAK